MIATLYLVVSCGVILCMVINSAIVLFDTGGDPQIVTGRDQLLKKLCIDIETLKGE